jgi:knotted carbamoyltransferase YgeW
VEPAVLNDPAAGKGGPRARIGDLIDALATLDHGLHERDFLLTWEQSTEDLRAVLLAARVLRRLHASQRPARLFDRGLAISYFRDFSTRTRYSFASASDLLGLQVMGIDETQIQVAHGETTRETAVMLGFLTEVVGIRDDIYLGRGHRFMTEYAAALDEALEEGTLARRPFMVNLQSDLDHPTQSMADLAHLASHFGGLENLAGKQIAVTWAYSPSYGKPLSVSQGVLALLSRFGCHLKLAHPPGYDLLPDVVARAQRQAQASGGSLEVLHDMSAAFEGAHVVYPKSWAPMAVHEERVRLLDVGDKQGLKDLEQRCLAQNAEYKDWEADETKMALTAGGDGSYMHCLPADITGVSCAAGEVSASVFAKHRTNTYAQANWKPFAIAAMIVLSKCADPVAFLRDCAA